MDDPPRFAFRNHGVRGTPSERGKLIRSENGSSTVAKVKLCISFPSLVVGYYRRLAPDPPVQVLDASITKGETIKSSNRARHDFWLVLCGKMRDAHTTMQNTPEKIKIATDGVTVPSEKHGNRYKGGVGVV